MCPERRRRTGSSGGNQPAGARAGPGHLGSAEEGLQPCLYRNYEKNWIAKQEPSRKSSSTRWPDALLRRDHYIPKVGGAPSRAEPLYTALLRPAAEVEWNDNRSCMSNDERELPWRD